MHRKIEVASKQRFCDCSPLSVSHSERFSLTTPLTDEEKRENRELEHDYKQSVIEDMIGKSYNEPQGRRMVNKGDGALILEWTLGKRRYSCHFQE
jgi:hypothetical protein